jgi:hypothetical protein
MCAVISTESGAAAVQVVETTSQQCPPENNSSTTTCIESADVGSGGVKVMWLWAATPIGLHSTKIVVKTDRATRRGFMVRLLSSS